METTASEREPQPGTITRLVVQKKDPQRVAVFIDGAFAFGVHQDVLVQFGLHKGLFLEVDRQRAIMTAERARRARVVALDYLAYKPRTEHEVNQKLLRKGFEMAVVEQTVVRLRELGYLDDAAYAREFVQRRFKAKGHGPRRLAADLRRRGLSAAVVEAALAGLEDEAMLEEARRHVAKRWSSLARETDTRKRRKKMMDYLLRRGYDYDLVRRVMDELESSG